MPNGETQLATTNSFHPGNSTTAPLSEQELNLIENIASGMNTRNAAIAAGYSESFADSTVYQKLKKATFIARLAESVKDLPDARIAIAKARLPLLARLESKALEKMEDDPELMLKYGKFTEREYKLAGLLSDAPQAQVNVTVNVASFAAQLLEHAHPGSSDSKRTVDVHPQTLPKKNMALHSGEGT